jgi:hypothetical protein
MIQRGRREKTNGSTRFVFIVSASQLEKPSFKFPIYIGNNNLIVFYLFLVTVKIKHILKYEQSSNKTNFQSNPQPNFIIDEWMEMGFNCYLLLGNRFHK